MKGRGIGTARGRATIMRGMFLNLCKCALSRISSSFFLFIANGTNLAHTRPHFFADHYVLFMQRVVGVVVQRYNPQEVSDDKCVAQHRTKSKRPVFCVLYLPLLYETTYLRAFMSQYFPSHHPRRLHATATTRPYLTGTAMRPIKRQHRLRHERKPRPIPN